MPVLEVCIIFLIWASWALVNFILGKNKGFQSGTLLKMPPSTPSMEEFGLYLQK